MEPLPTEQEGETHHNLSCMKNIFTMEVPLLPCKLAFFLVGAINATTISFRQPFLTSVGLSASQAGYISAVSCVVAALTAPCWGILADKTGKRSILMILCISLGLLVFATPWVAGELTIKPCRVNDTDVDKDYRNVSSNVLRSICESSEFTEGSSSLFNAMFVLWVLIAVVIIPLEGLLISAVMNVIESNPRTTQNFGQQRLFGSISAGFAVFLGGVAADNFSHETLSKYSIVFFIFSPFALVLSLVTILLFKYVAPHESDGVKNLITIPESSKIESPIESQESQVSNSSALRDAEKRDTDLQQSSEEKTEGINRFRIMMQLFSKAHTIVVMSTVLVQGTMFNLFMSYILLAIVDEMKASKTSMGFSLMIAKMSEAIMFFFTERTLRFFKGQINSVEIAMLSWVVRFLACSYIENAWLIALPQVLNSLGFALFMAAMVEHLDEITPHAVHSTMFTLFSSLQFTGGGFVANIGGPVYEEYGARVLFRGAAVFGGVWSCGLFLYFHGCKLRRNGFLCRSHEPAVDG